MNKAIRNPDLYHGHHKTNQYFEGWYFKVVDAKAKHAFAFIPGISMGLTQDEGHAFIQWLDASKQSSHYFQYAKQDFSPYKEDFKVFVKDSYFSLNAMNIDLRNETHSVTGTLEFYEIEKWPDSKLNPGSMGYFNYLTFMECYSHVVALEGNIEGELTVDGERIDFSGGKVYIEKNWGKSFPLSYIWVQSNHFDKEGVHLTASIGRVPFRFLTFTGFLTAIKVDGHLYKFTTMNRSKFSVHKIENGFQLVFKNRKHKLTIETHTEPSQFIHCLGPRRGNMNMDVFESLTSTMRVSLYHLRHKKMLFEGKAHHVGIEQMGDINLL